MSSYTNILHNNTNTLASAFTAAAKTHATRSLVNGVTWNGDINFSSLGNDFKSALLAFDQKMVLPEKCQRARELDTQTKAILDAHFNTFISCVSSVNDMRQAEAFALMFRYLFYVRSIRIAGKKSRILFYYLFKRLYQIFPKTCCELVQLLPEFGYFGDLDALIEQMGDAPDVFSAVEQVYIKHLDTDCKLIFGTPLADVSLDQAEQLNQRLKKMSSGEIREFLGRDSISLAAKWFKREGKCNSDHRDSVLIRIYFPNGGIKELQSSSDPEARLKAKKRLNYSHQRLRNVVSALTQILLVGETMMCEVNDSHRMWADIIHKDAPAKFVTKYRKALANERLNEPVPQSMKDTGNRYATDNDRVQCRKNLLDTLIKNKLHGAAQDIDRLSKIVFEHINYSRYMPRRNVISPTLSTTERKIIATQWNDMISKLQAEIIDVIEEAYADLVEAGEQFEHFVDPRNVIPIIDTSGSMHIAKVQDKAIGLGILASHLSSMPGCMISFSDKPQVFKLDLSAESDVFDHFLTVVNGPTGLSTNIDATYDCMLGLMTASSAPSTNFAMLYLTDGQFDSSLVPFNTRLEGTALGRMQQKFTAAGFALPRTIFWNLNSRSPGFPASATSIGVQLVSGYSQSLMLQVFTGDYTYVWQEDGSMKVDVDPWVAFHKAITHKGYDLVEKIVTAVGEGCLGTLKYL